MSNKFGPYTNKIEFFFTETQFFNSGGHFCRQQIIRQVEFFGPISSNGRKEKKLSNEFEIDMRRIQPIIPFIFGKRIRVFFPSYWR